LDLTEDAVKQRLVRGRKMLQDEVQTFVEGALRRTAPGQAFSGAVLAMLPVAAAAPAATAGLGAGAKGTAAAKSVFWPRGSYRWRRFSVSPPASARNV